MASAPGGRGRGRVSIRAAGQQGDAGVQGSGLGAQGSGLRASGAGLRAWDAAPPQVHHDLNMQNQIATALLQLCAVANPTGAPQASEQKFQTRAPET